MQTTNNWWLYLIRCGDGTLYTGITTDVTRRLDEHRAGTGAKYLRGRGHLQLVFSKPVGTYSDALKLEQHIKKQPKSTKEKLVRGELKLSNKGMLSAEC